MIDWSAFDSVPTKKQVALYREWKIYLSDSSLTKNQIEQRARCFAEQNRRPND